MLLIGENLNVVVKVFGKAFKEKDPGPIAEEARKQKEKGILNVYQQQKLLV